PRVDDHDRRLHFVRLPRALAKRAAAPRARRSRRLSRALRRRRVARADLDRRRSRLAVAVTRGRLAFAHALRGARVTATAAAAVAVEEVAASARTAARLRRRHAVAAAHRVVHVADGDGTAGAALGAAA